MKTIKVMDILLCLSLILLLTGNVRGGCSRFNGPSGSNECVLLRPYYNRHQWATCLTNTYIRTYSKGNHTCRDFSATYCWYQCMVEVHDIDEGPVYDSCACGPDAPSNVTTQPTVSTSAIPDWCFSPSGTECSWYRDCLEKRYPCKEKGNSYALDYAEKFCNLYQDHYSEFDNIGQQWIDGVRKCLQVNLVPILRPFVTTSCEGIKQMAFNSHSGCYLYPDVGKPSICDIGWVNWARVFWTVKSAVIQDARATFKQMLDVAQSCGTELLSSGMKLIKLTLKQAKDTVQRSLDEIAEHVSNVISEKMDWIEKGIMHFGYPTLDKLNRRKRATDNDTDIDIFYINILIASKSEFDLNAENIPATNVSAEAIDVAKAIENGDVRVEMEEGLEFTEFSICSNYNCTETSLKVTPPPPEEKEDGGMRSTTIIVVVVVTVAIVLTVLAVVVLRKKAQVLKTFFGI